MKRIHPEPHNHFIEGDAKMTDRLRIKLWGLVTSEMRRELSREFNRAIKEDEKDRTAN